MTVFPSFSLITQSAWPPEWSRRRNVVRPEVVFDEIRRLKGDHIGGRGCDRRLPLRKRAASAHAFGRSLEADEPSDQGVVARVSGQRIIEGKPVV